MGMKGHRRHDGKRPGFGELMIEALEEVASIERGDSSPARVQRYHLTARDIRVGPPPEYGADRVKTLRSRMKLSQAVFAAVLNVSVATVRSWEHGLRAPDGPSRRLLQITEQHPNTIAATIR